MNVDNRIRKDLRVWLLTRPSCFSCWNSGTRKTWRTRWNSEVRTPHRNRELSNLTWLLFIWKRVPCETGSRRRHRGNYLHLWSFSNLARNSVAYHSYDCIVASIDEYLRFIFFPFVSFCLVRSQSAIRIQVILPMYADADVGTYGAKATRFFTKLHLPSVCSVFARSLNFPINKLEN